MSTAAFPTLPGLTWPVRRSPIWQTRTQKSVSGKRVNLADWSSPKWQWSVTFNFLRGSSPYAEFQTMAGFFNSRQGSYDSFLYTDPNDNSVSGSTIGSGDGATRAFQLSRVYGSTVASYSEPIFAPLAVSQITVGSTVISSTAYSLAYWGSTAPGTITFSSLSIPPSGQAVAATFTFAWPCSFDSDRMDYDEFVRTIWEAKSVSWTSLK